MKSLLYIVKSTLGGLLVGGLVLVIPITFLATPSTNDDDSYSGEYLSSSASPHTNPQEQFQAIVVAVRAHARSMFWWPVALVTLVGVVLLIAIRTNDRAPPEKFPTARVHVTI